MINSCEIKPSAQARLLFEVMGSTLGVSPDNVIHSLYSKGSNYIGSDGIPVLRLYGQGFDDFVYALNGVGLLIGLKIPEVLGEYSTLLESMIPGIIEAMTKGMEDDTMELD